MAPPPTLRSRTLGALLGVHAGDSLGATLEFLAWETIAEKYPPPRHHRDMTGGGTFAWPPGHATDDTDLTRAVLLAYHYLRSPPQTASAANGHGVVHLAAQNFASWCRGDWPGRTRGEMPRDIGGATMTGIRRFQQSQDAASSGAGEGSAGNGSLMRCIPTALFQGDWERMVDESVRISAITHDDPHCTLACAAYNAMARALVEGKGAGDAIEEGLKAVGDAEVVVAGLGKVNSAKLSLVGKRVEAAILAGRDLVTIGDLADNGPRKATNGPKVLPFRAAGYVLESLTLAVAALVDDRFLEDVLVDVVRIGKDTDTNGAIAGGLLGARDGVEAIPLRWREKLQFAKEFEEMVDAML